MIKEVTPPIAYQKLKEIGESILIDCRTEKEWVNIGAPDLSQIDKSVLKIELVRQDQSINSNFTGQVEEYATYETPIFIICKSGARSAAACQMLLKVGFTDVTNVTEGFEGHAHYNDGSEILDGWKSHSLPWQK